MSNTAKTPEPLALRLADILQAGENFYGESTLWFDSKLADAAGDAADELRRLAAVEAHSDDLENVIQSLGDQIDAKTDQIIKLMRELEAFGAKLNSVEADAERYRWLSERPTWTVAYKVKLAPDGSRYRAWRMLDEGERWGQWWPTHAEAVDAAMAAEAKG